MVYLASCSISRLISAAMEHSHVDDNVYEIESGEYDSWSSNRFRVLEGSGMRRLEENGLEHQSVAKSFVSGLGRLARDAKVVAVHKNWASDSGKAAREEAFRIFSDAVATKCGGDANIKLCWYGAPIQEISQIVSHGFSCHKHSDNCNGASQSSHGVGLYLSPRTFSIDCVSSSAMDQNGVRHMLLCKVILGKVECILPGSTQFHPSSSDFDTGVDNSLAPKKYIIWPAFMNSHVQPIYVLSFKAPRPNRGIKKSVNVMKPTSPWMSFPMLISALSRFLDPKKMNSIQKCHNEFIRNNIRRPQLINRVRHIAGDDLLIALIGNYKRNKVFSID